MIKNSIELTNIRLQQGLFWLTEKPPSVNFYKEIILSLIVVLIFLNIIFISLNNFNSERASKLSEQLTEANDSGYPRLLAACLNGDTIIDKISKVGLFNDKAIVIKLVGEERK